MIGELIVYEMAGQRRCIHAPAGWKHEVGGSERCHIMLNGVGVPDVIFSFVRDGAGGVQLLDERDELLYEATLPFETEVLGMSFVMFEPHNLLEAPFAVDTPPEGPLVLKSGDDATMLNVAPGRLLCAGSSPDSDIVLPDGPNYAYVLWWHGTQHMHIAVLDDSEGGAWLADNEWGQQEAVTLPITLQAGSWLCEIACLSIP